MQLTIASEESSVTNIRPQQQQPKHQHQCFEWHAANINNRLVSLILSPVATVCKTLHPDQQRRILGRISMI